jgi:hypothetical protein
VADRLTDEQAALVFRRAAELEAAQGGPGGDELDVETIEAAGREAGLSPAAVREAVAEVRARGVDGSPGASVVLTDAVASRTVDGSAGSVARAVFEVLDGEYLAPDRDLGERAVWVPERGIEATVERAIEGSDLRPVRRLVAAVVPVPGEPRTHVRFEADVAGPSAGARAGVPLAAGVAGGAVAAGLVDPMAGLGVAAAGVVVAGLGWASVRSARRRARAQVTGALERFLDWLDRR